MPSGDSNVTINVFANTGQANAALKQLGINLGQMGGRINTNTQQFTSLDKATSGLVNNVKGLVAAYVGLRAAVATVQQLVAVNRDYEDTMQAVRAVTEQAPGFTENAFKKMGEEARRLGAITRFSASQAADGLKYLGMAGFTAEQATASLEATLKLAQAGNLELGTSADIVSNIMTQFGASADRTSEFVDALAATASRSNTDVLQLGEAMKYVGPISGGMGHTVQDTAAALGTLGNAGVQASMAGTSLRGVLIQLADTNSKAYRTLVDMGLSAQELSPQLNTVQQLMTNMARVGVNASNAYALFGSRAGVAADILVANLPVLEQMTKITNNARGAADKMAATMDDSLKGGILRVKSAWEELLLQIGDGGLGEGLRSSVDALEDLLVGFNEAGVGANIGRKIGQAFIMVQSAVSASVPVFEFMLKGIQALIKPVGYAAAAFIALKIASSVASMEVGAGVLRMRAALSSLSLQLGAVGVSFRTVGLVGKQVFLELAVAARAGAMAMKIAFVAATAGIIIALELIMSKMIEATKLVEDMKGVGDSVDEQADFIEEIETLGKAAKNDDDVKEIARRLVERHKALEKLSERIASDDSLSDEAKAAKLAQTLNAMRQIEQMAQKAESGKTIKMRVTQINEKTGESEVVEKEFTNKNFRARLEENVKLNASIEETKARIEATEEAEREAIAAGKERSDEVRDMLKEWDKLNEIKNIEDTVPKNLQIDAFLELQGLDSIEELEGEIERIRTDLASDPLKLTSEEDKLRLEEMLAITEKIQAIEKANKEKKVKAKEATKDLQMEMAILRAKISGNTAEQKALERKQQIEEKTAELKEKGVKNAAAEAQKLIDLQIAANEATSNASAGKTAGIAGAAAGALNTIVGKSANELIAMETKAARQQQEKINTNLQEQRKVLEEIRDKKGAVGVFV